VRHAQPGISAPEINGYTALYSELDVLSNGDLIDNSPAVELAALHNVRAAAAIDSDTAVPDVSTFKHEFWPS
jgi:hypothetical protein